MTAVSFDHVDLSVDGTVLLRDLSFEVAAGELVGVIGASGSGKTTLLRGVAGFASVSRGALRFDGLDVSSVPVARRGVGMVFQAPALFTHRSVRGNVAFPLELARREIGEIRERVGAEARALHVEHLLERRPDQLSRGEEQLVQIARTMVKVPRVLLLDEPLASLDETTRQRMRTELCLLQAGYGVTTLMSTNDWRDAVQMPGRLIVVHAGRVVQVGSVDEVRRSPATVDAAMTTSDGQLQRVRVVRDDDGIWLVRVGASDAEPRRRAFGASLADRHGDELLAVRRPGDDRELLFDPVSSLAVTD